MDKQHDKVMLWPSGSGGHVIFSRYFGVGQQNLCPCKGVGHAFWGHHFFSNTPAHYPPPPPNTYIDRSLIVDFSSSYRKCFIFFSARERARWTKSCNLIGSGSGRHFPILTAVNGTGRAGVSYMYRNLGKNCALGLEHGPRPAASGRTQDLWHSCSQYGPPGRQIIYIYMLSSLPPYC